MHNSVRPLQTKSLACFCMTPERREAYDGMILSVLQDDEAKLLIEQAKAKLLDDAEKHAFNSERAKQVFQMAIERAIWGKYGATGVGTVRSIRGEGVIEAIAQRFTDEFKAWLGVSDQRPARRGVLAKLFGR